MKLFYNCFIKLFDNCFMKLFDNCFMKLFDNCSVQFTAFYLSLETNSIIFKATFENFSVVFLSFFFQTKSLPPPYTPPPSIHLIPSILMTQFQRFWFLLFFFKISLFQIIIKNLRKCIAFNFSLELFTFNFSLQLFTFNFSLELFTFNFSF